MTTGPLCMPTEVETVAKITKRQSTIMMCALNEFYFLWPV